MQTAGIAVGIASLSLAAMLLWARWRQVRALESLQTRIERAAGEAMPDPSGSADEPTLPAPVARYLDHALPDGGRLIGRLRYAQRGRLRTRGSSHRWMDFRADQVVVPAATAFLWDARVTLLPWIPLRVVASLIDGRGAGRVALLSTFALGKADGGLEMNSGTMHRFLAEAVWYPTALLPSEHLSWQPIDDHRAQATLTAHGISVSLEFRFNQRDEVESVYAPGRWGSFDGGYRQLPWEGRFQDYEWRDGVRVPGRAEVGWVESGEWRPVWQGRIDDMLFEWR